MWPKPGFKERFIEKRKPNVDRLCQWNSPVVGSGSGLVSVLAWTQSLTRVSQWLPAGQSFFFMAETGCGDLLLCNPPLHLCLWHKTELSDTDEWFVGGFYEMNTERLTDVSVPPFQRKGWITTCPRGQRDRDSFLCSCLKNKRSWPKFGINIVQLLNEEQFTVCSHG